MPSVARIRCFITTRKNNYSSYPTTKGPSHQWSYERGGEWATSQEDWLRYNSLKKGVESSQCLRELSAGSPVLVFFSVSKSGEGPFKLIQIDDETLFVQKKRRRKIFRSSYVKPLKKWKLNKNENVNDEDTDDNLEGTDSSVEATTDEAVYTSTTLAAQQTQLNHALKVEINKKTREFAKSRHA